MQKESGGNSDGANNDRTASIDRQEERKENRHSSTCGPLQLFSLVAPMPTTFSSQVQPAIPPIKLPRVLRSKAGASIPMGQGDMSPPNILEMMSFRLGLFYPVTATTVVCCIILKQILCVVLQKRFRPLDPQSSFMPPNNPLKSTPLV